VDRALSGNGYHQVDPIARYYIDNNIPLLWSADEDWTRLGDNVVEFMQDLKNYGYTGGLCLPILVRKTHEDSLI